MVMLLIPYFPNNSPDSKMILSLTSTATQIFGKYMKTFLVFYVFCANLCRKSVNGDLESVKHIEDVSKHIFLLLLRA